MKIFLLLLVSFFFQTTFATQCEVTRAAFDVGSGSTKMKVAKLDICKTQIVSLLLDESRPVAYKEDLAISPNKNLSPTILQKGILALNELKEKAKNLGANEFAGVATQVFREAQNSSQALALLNSQTGIKITLITQQEEGELGFWAAAALTQIPVSKLIVWDIGGASQQITSMDNTQPLLFQGTLASVSFKNSIIKDIQNKNPQDTKSPNPINKRQAAAAIRLARADAVGVSTPIRNLIQQGAEVVGIGGVHNSSLLKQINNQRSDYTRQELNHTVQKRMGLSDEQIGGDYASTEVSNLLLVLGFMVDLKIKKVTVKNVTLSDGIFLQNKYWTSNSLRNEEP